MKVFRNIEDINTPGAGAVTVGTFDGFHLGHQSILDRMKEFARRQELIPTIVTFDPHPRKVVGGEPHNIRILTTTDEKLAIFESSGIEQVVVIHFTKEFAKLSSEEFVKALLVDKLSVKQMVTGYDHHFGHNREGGHEELKTLGGKFGFSVSQVPAFNLNGEVVSSSAIRQLLTIGDVEKAARFMGRPYMLTGTVSQGDGRGKEIGFPTANIQVSEGDKLFPARGVYAVDIMLQNRLYSGMMNIGVRPTFDFDRLTLEAHIFNFDAEIYGQQLAVFFKKFIRQERRFSGIEELKAQLNEDKIACENI